MNDRLVWIDCEMTGLDTGADALIEVAALVTDFDLNVLGAGCRRRHQAAGRGARPDAATSSATMHTKLGSARRASTTASTSPPPSRWSSTTSVRGARGRQGAARRQHRRHRPAVPGPRHADARVVPALPHRRRLVDQGARRAAGIPRAYFASPPKGGNHRALADIQESIEELRYYRAAVFVPPPGPDSDAARAPRARARRLADGPAHVPTP